jgi:PTH1 family peptidyl-tRNA hydrolase
MYIVVGLGNPGEEYARTRHNTGRMAADLIAEKHLEGVKVITPDTFMNEAGKFVKKYVTSEAEAEHLIVISDDIDSPLGSLKIQTNRGSGGHRGFESIEAALGTKAFIKVKIGVLPKNIFGNPKKPKGDDKVSKFILGEYKTSEKEVLDKVLRNVVTAVVTVVESGVSAAQTQFNS